MPVLASNRADWAEVERGSAGPVRRAAKCNTDRTKHHAFSPRPQSFHPGCGSGQHPRAFDRCERVLDHRPSYANIVGEPVKRGLKSPVAKPARLPGFSNLTGGPWAGAADGA